MDGRRGRVVCHMDKGSDLKNESTERGCIHDNE